MYSFNRENYERRMKWFAGARFGMIIHWGLYSIGGRGCLMRDFEQIPEEEYLPYFDEFNPVDYDPSKWARAAKEAGMEYIVLTAKHHDGFCLFDSKYTDFKATNTKAGRDLIAEYVEALRVEGLRVGLYYSLLDWHHPDYPHYGDQRHPMRNHPECGNENRDFNRYLDYMHNQIRELCTNYGKIDILYLDFSYGNLRGEAWRGTELVNMVRSLQPDIILDNRLEVGDGTYSSLVAGNPTPYHGDFVTPERFIPPDCVVDANGNDAYWEATFTMNQHWGFNPVDQFWKPSSLLIKKLVECVSKGGNMILNVGPDARGNFPEQSMKILSEIGVWMKANGRSIKGCGKAGIPKPEFGRITRNGNRLYYHLYENTIGPMPLPGIRREDVKSIRYLANGAEAVCPKDGFYHDYPDVVFVDLGLNPELPDPVDTVLEVILKE